MQFSRCMPVNAGQFSRISRLTCERNVITPASGKGWRSQTIMLPDSCSPLAGKMRKRRSRIAAVAGRPARRLHSEPETSKDGFEDGDGAASWFRRGGRRRQRPRGGRAGGRRDPSRGVLVVKFWTQNRGLYANNRIEIINRDPKQGAFRKDLRVPSAYPPTRPRACKLQLVYLQHMFRYFCRLSPETAHPFLHWMLDMEEASAQIDDQPIVPATGHIRTGSSVVQRRLKTSHRAP